MACSELATRDCATCSLCSLSSSSFCVTRSFCSSWETSASRLLSSANFLSCIASVSCSLFSLCWWLVCQSSTRSSRLCRSVMERCHWSCCSFIVPIICLSLLSFSSTLVISCPIRDSFSSILDLSLSILYRSFCSACFSSSNLPMPSSSSCAECCWYSSKAVLASSRSWKSSNCLCKTLISSPCSATLPFSCTTSSGSAMGPAPPSTDIPAAFICASNAIACASTSPLSFKA
mmetsp:Transcript_1802/g.4198  ORF Transcript_1802/g.4198 Transcript_1802/m.4198 type:complete len:232 (+) Transcript_1802:2029-2724(+)